MPKFDHYDEATSLGDADLALVSQGGVTKKITGAALKTEPSGVPAVAEGVLALDLGAASVFSVTLTEDVTEITLSNVPAAGKVAAFTLILTQDETGSRSITWPSGTKWNAGTAPELTADPGGVDVLTFISIDSGTSWMGFVAGQAMAEPA